MRQVPPILLEKLALLRQRVRVFMLLRGLACVLSLIIVVLVVACFVDWLVDLWDDTPWTFRQIMLFGQLALAASALLGFVIAPQLKRVRDEMLALFVEHKRPEFQHRLISALELNKPHARTEGMSSELLAAMTQEAVQQSRPVDFAALADVTPVKRTSLVFLVVAGVAGLLLLINGETAFALLRRQLLQDVDIPRAVAVVSAADGIWPSGEEVTLKFDVFGLAPDDHRVGSVRIREKGDDGRSFSVPMTHDVESVWSGGATYIAKVPPGSVDFSYKAKVGDGRTRVPGKVQYVARPTIIDQKAYVRLHDYAGLSPADALNDVRTNYEQLHPRGDIIGMPDLSARVVIKTQKPILKAVLDIYGSPFPDLTGPDVKTKGITRVQDRRNLALANLSGALLAPLPFGPIRGPSAANAALAPIPLRRYPQEFITPTDHVEWRFDLKPTETSYRVTVFDIHGFASKTESVRAIKIEPEPYPTAVLHAEEWPPLPQFKSKSKAPSTLDFDGLPLPLVEEGRPGRLKISYEAYGPYGVGKALLQIRVYRGGTGGSADDAKKLMLETYLPLKETEADPTRLFDKTKGAFVDSPGSEQIQLYAAPVGGPRESWPRVIAGGRFDYLPAGILDPATGDEFVFKAGDQVAVWVEVYNCNPDGKKALMAKSRVREKELVPFEQFEKWCRDTLQEAGRIEALMYLQQQVYQQK